MLENLLFVAFQGRVTALDRDTGQLVWHWRSPKGSGYTTILLDGDRLIVSVMGYTYCLVPTTGQQLWFNELAGQGTGVPSLASLRGGSTANPAAAASEEAKQHAAAT